MQVHPADMKQATVANLGEKRHVHTQEGQEPECSMRIVKKLVHHESRDLRSVGFCGERKKLALRFNMFYLKKIFNTKKMNRSPRKSRNISQKIEKSRNILKNIDAANGS